MSLEQLPPTNALLAPIINRIKKRHLDLRAEVRRNLSSPDSPRPNIIDLYLSSGESQYYASGMPFLSTLRATLDEAFRMELITGREKGEMENKAKTKFNHDKEVGIPFCLVELSLRSIGKIGIVADPDKDIGSLIVFSSFDEEVGSFLDTKNIESIVNISRYSENSLAIARAVYKKIHSREVEAKIELGSCTQIDVDKVLSIFSGEDSQFMVVRDGKGFKTYVGRNLFGKLENGEAYGLVPKKISGFKMTVRVEGSSLIFGRHLSPALARTR